MSSAQPTRCELSAIALDDSGAGVGASGQTAVHVMDLLPGERAEVVIDHISPHRPEAWGRVLRRIGPPSPDRVAPVCPGFGRCGGCVWQHLAYPAQLAAKRARVAAALGEPSPELTGYRNKGKYVVGHSGDHLVLGAYAPRSHEVVDTLGCRVVAPIIDEVATWVRGAAERAQLAAYDERARTGELRYVIIREAQGDVMVVLVAAPRTPRAKLDAVAAALGNHPAMHGVVVVENDRRDGAIVPSGTSATVLRGHGHLVERLDGVPVEVGAGEFLQVNRAQAAAMYARVAELAEARPGIQAIDLFAGAVEIDRDAVAQLRRAAQRAGLPLTAIAGDVGDVRGQLGAHPDVVVVNPPRKGLSGGARAFLAELAAPTAVYVSCGPEALGRDLVALARQGYTPDVIEPFDLMPGTPQIETIVRLRRPPRAARRGLR
ncbi:MAG: class I SAM-dependent RNA methyltransferase [Deltaproteobacteria bacterium]|nr:MAG: class I SAM-dependent RNA methyltransferase [Deltaproteobacteria bacterium]